MASFRKETVEKHIRKKHPGCPDFAIERFATLVSERDWKNAGLGTAVGIIMQTFLRHNMTDYDQLLLSGIEQREARRRVQWKVDRMIAEWKKQPSSQ
jgi:hypothetical protein